MFGRSAGVIIVGAGHGCGVDGRAVLDYTKAIMTQPKALRLLLGIVI